MALHALTTFDEGVVGTLHQVMEPSNPLTRPSRLRPRSVWYAAAGDLVPRFIRFSACLLVCFAASSAGLTGCQRGENWTAQTSVTGNNLYGVHFVDEMTGWAVGTDVMRATTDGGETWEMQFGPTEYLRDVQFLDQSTGWAVGSDEEYPFNSTSDGGKNWTGMDAGRYLHAVHFLDANTGWLAVPRARIRPVETPPEREETAVSSRTVAHGSLPGTARSGAGQLASTPRHRRHRGRSLA